MKRLLRPLGVLFTCLVTVTVSSQSFYEAKFLSGVADFNRGAYARAVDELRVAAFGRVDDVARYEIAEIYLVVANKKLDRVDDSRIAALKVIHADQVSPVYTTLDLTHDLRAAFEALLPSLLTREQLFQAPAFERFASQAPVVQSGTPGVSTRPRPSVPTPTKQPNVAVTVRKNDDQVTKPPPEIDYGRLALEHVAAGDESGGQRYADLALAADPTNVNAHTALAQIARAHIRWSDVAEHYAAVQRRRQLTDDESADYVIALANIGRVADALGVGRGLPPSVLSRSDVRQALQAIEPNPTPQPAPRPVSPAPMPVAPTPVPAPVAPPSATDSTKQPAPRPVSPAPMPVAPTPVPAPVAPASTTDSTTQPVPSQIAAAERMLGVSNIAGAQRELRRIAALPNLQRSDRLALARALSQTTLYAESSAQYRKTYPLKAGEESHMFYEAVNRYQLSDYDLARQLMARALPALPQTPAILAYRDRIMGQK
ncbi:MAG: hypothetical protein M3P29_12750 [Acidobacteriota bacterium]|nr:hypothetical protein [Acidobacteriota bacterium]